MSDVIGEQHGKIFSITLNRVEKCNAFDDTMIKNLQQIFEEARDNANIKVIILKANGKHFSAGADVSWMQRMTHYSMEENKTDAMHLARLMHTIYACEKPTIAMVQGDAFGGGAGIAATCDITIASENARFCFSEVKLGLIPAVISPYVIRAIGERKATELFMTAEMIHAQSAYDIQLIQHCVPQEKLSAFTFDLAEKITKNAPLAVKAAKAMVRLVGGQPIDDAMQKLTASLIASIRVSSEGQNGLNAFLNKTKPSWN